MPSIADAIGIDYRGAEANISASGRGGFSYDAVSQAFKAPAPTIPTAGPDISSMISKSGSSPGANIDVYG